MINAYSNAPNISANNTIAGFLSTSSNTLFLKNFAVQISFILHGLHASVWTLFMMVVVC